MELVRWVTRSARHAVRTVAQLVNDFLHPSNGLFRDFAFAVDDTRNRFDRDFGSLGNFFHGDAHNNPMSKQV